MAEEITAAERSAEKTISDAEKKAQLILSGAREKAKSERKRILENAESALDTLKQSYDKNITAAVNKAVEILKSWFLKNI